MLSGLDYYCTDTTPSTVLAYAEGGPPAPQPGRSLLDLTLDSASPGSKSDASAEMILCSDPTGIHSSDRLSLFWVNFVVLSLSPSLDALKVKTCPVCN